MTFTFENVPGEAVSRIIEEVRKHGVYFSLFWSSKTRREGYFESVAGRGDFCHEGSRLTVKIDRNPGHFSRLIIKGGLKQLVSEACESLDRLRDPVQQQHADADAKQNARV